MAAIDVSALGTAVLENIQAVSLVGVACLGMWGAISAFRVLRELLEVGPSASASSGGVGGGASSDRLADVREHAQQMQLVGEGQSAAFAQAESRDQFDNDWDAFEREQEGEK